MDLLMQLAESLSPGARQLLLRDGVSLEEENAHTRRFISKFRFPNPLRATYAKVYEMTRAGSQPSEHRLLPADREAVAALRFHFSGEYESADVLVDRWIGPDGCIVLECSGSRRFFSVSFEDDHRISMHPDFDETTAELFPTTDILLNSPELLKDYGRMLARAAEYIDSTGTRPLYRYADPELDLACVDFYLRHQVASEFVRFALSAKFWTTVGEKLPSIGGEFMPPDEARALVAKMDSAGRLGSEDAHLTCRSCNEPVYVPFEQLGSSARCQSCGNQVGTTDLVLHVYDAIAMRQMVDDTKLPVVACFWSPENWESTLGGAAFLHDAAIRSDGRFSSLLVDVSVMDEVANTHAVTEVPTFVRFERGREVARYMGSMSVKEVLEFAGVTR